MVRNGRSAMTQTLIGPTTRTEPWQTQAKQVTESIPADALVTFRLTFPGAPDVGLLLPEDLAEQLLTVLDALANGSSIQTRAMPKVLTTTEAAKILDISRPTLMKLVRGGKIDSHQVGTHTRLKTADVFDFREKKNAAKDAAFNKLRN